MFTLLPLLTRPEYEVNVHFEINMKMKKERREREPILSRIFKGKDTLLTFLEGEPVRGRKVVTDKKDRRSRSIQPRSPKHRDTYYAKKKRGRSESVHARENKDKTRRTKNALRCDGTRGRRRGEARTKGRKRVSRAR